MNISAAATSRYTAKAYDPSRKIPEDQIRELQAVLRFSPSSVNLQPWHFLIADSETAKARVATATRGAYHFNERKVLDASHVIVFASHTDVTTAHLDRLLAQEERDGRFQAEGAKDGQRQGRQTFVNLHRTELRDLQPWIDRQVYLALGTLLLSAGAMGIDATPIEGFDLAILDAELGLRERGLRSLALCALGYRAESDFNARLPKSRLPAEAVFTRL
ncbi:MAG: oxygen-insensitive NAD(P)H nitroreductase [Paucibacter sp.]|nr:oxygen-insensitive NAD(P)H nitroreductase [Roseateles sp.]